MLKRRSRPKPMSAERRARQSEIARAQHAQRRGFEIPEHLRDEYMRLRRLGVRTDRIWQRLGLAALLLGLLTATVGEGEAHHAPSGWLYPRGCCSAVDCFQINGGDVERTVSGWLIKSTQEVIGFEDTQESGDGHWHRCAKDTSKPNSPTRTHTGNSRKCLYVPGAEQ